MKLKKKTYAKFALLLTSMLWGSTFALVKLATDAFSASFVIAFRFTIASVVLLIVAFPLRNLLNRKYWTDGFWMGLTLFISYFLQVTGLSLDATPGKSAFLCTTYTVFVPFIYWFATKELPQIRHVICIFLCFIGIGILSLQGRSGIATALCLYLQSYGLKYAEASIGGMLLSLESVFGVIFSIIIYQEKITLRMLLGFIVIFTAIILAQYEKEAVE